MHSAATAKQPGPAQPQPSPARSLQGARHGRGHVPHSCRHGAWLGGHRRAAETPLNMRPQCPLSKASAHVQPAWSPQLQGQGNQRRDLWVQSTWPRACPHCFLLWSPLLLPPPQAPFLTLPVLCSATPQPCRPLLPHGERPHSLPASRSQGPSHPISCTMHARGGRLRAPPLQVGTSACQGQAVTMGEPLGVCWGPRRTDHCPVWALTCLGAGWPHQTSSRPWPSAPPWS